MDKNEIKQNAAIAVALFKEVHDLLGSSYLAETNRANTAAALTAGMLANTQLIG